MQFSRSMGGWLIAEMNYSELLLYIRFKNPMERLLGRSAVLQISLITVYMFEWADNEQRL